LGLGLMITRSLAELHHGTVTASSEGHGKGSVFTIRLNPVMALEVPGNQGATPGHSSAPATTSPASHQRRILLVEDNEDKLRVMAKVIRSFGYEVQTAKGVKDALELAEKQKFHILVSDIGLPDGSGWEIMDQLRRKQSLRGIALSGYGMDEDFRKSREAGFEK